jgi:hypothetical protein
MMVSPALVHAFGEEQNILDKAGGASLRPKGRRRRILAFSYKERLRVRVYTSIRSCLGGSPNIPEADDRHFPPCVF